MPASIALDDRLWETRGDVSVRGRGFYNGEYVDTTSIAELVESTSGRTELKSLLSSINGFYAVVVVRNPETILATDRMRSCPLFYAMRGDTILVSDDCGWLIKKTDVQNRSKQSQIEYETSRFVMGSNTLYEDVYQVQAGELVTHDTSRDDLIREPYRLHTVTEQQYTTDGLRNRFLSVLDAAFKRLTQVAGGRPIAVPLSGGYDSRLIAVMLKRIGYDKVITYSVNTGEDITVARDVAENLDLPWVTAGLTHDDWRSFYDSPRWNRYFDRAGWIGSLPSPTHVLALNHLVEQGNLPTNALYVPGESALDTMKATPTGLEGERKIDLQTLTSLILDQHFKYNEWTTIPRDEFTARVAETIELGSSAEPQSMVEAFERWRLKERRAKLIVNGVRSFDFCGHGWWLPLEDHRLYEFWRRVPIEQKRHRHFYESFIKDLYATVADVDETTASTVADTTFRSRVASRVRGRYIWPYAKRAYKVWDRSWLKRLYLRRVCGDDIYNKDPRFGIMSKTTFRSVYKGQSYPFFSLLAGETTGSIEFET
ncbi:asparagine synthase-related protein [Natronorubrum sp. FCH18a]|uniref:asparagine synthase-related protein n=1 Tax=Natronorubrum sp. FCH18a TaxID=3447018 RepID=UPI003F51510F